VSGQQFTTYNGKRYRVCVYECAGDTWGGFVEDRRYYLGGTGVWPTRAAAMLAAARIVAEDALLEDYREPLLCQA
jgi:hypothetical protein